MTLKSFYFVIPGPGKCGTTSPSSVINNFIQYQNTLIIQSDPLIQKSSDSIKKITCNWKPNIEKNVSMSTLNVANETPQVEEVVFTDDSGSRIETWMDITYGENNPLGKSISNAVTVGSKLTIAIYIKDTSGDFDLKVNECFAFGDEEKERRIVETNQQQKQLIKLVQDGCSMKKELIDDFTKLTSNTLRNLQLTNSKIISSVKSNQLNNKLFEATTIAYSTISVFKFPERASISFSCNIQLCKFKCSEMCPTSKMVPQQQQQQQQVEQRSKMSPLIEPEIINVTTMSNGSVKTKDQKQITTGQFNSNKSNLTTTTANEDEKTNHNNHKEVKKDELNDSPISLLPLVLNHTIYYTKSLEYDLNGDYYEVKKVKFNDTTTTTTTGTNSTRVKRHLTKYNSTEKVQTNNNINSKNGNENNNNNINDFSVKRTLNVIAPNFDEPDVINSLFQKYFTTTTTSDEDDVLDFIVCFPITWLIVSLILLLFSTISTVTLITYYIIQKYKFTRSNTLSKVTFGNCTTSFHRNNQLMRKGNYC